MGGTDEAAGFGRVGRTKERAFRALLLASTLAGIVALGGLLVYVGWQAFNLQAASTSWFALVGGVGLAPAVVAAALLRRRGHSVAVGLESLVTLFGGGMLAGGAGIFFVVVDPVAWFATALAAGLTVGATVAVNRYTGLPAWPRVGFAAVVTWLALLGVPGTVPSLAGVVGGLSVLPSDVVIYALSLALPASAAVGALVAARTDDRRRGLRAGALGAVATVAIGVAVGLVTGVGPAGGLLVAVFGLLPAGVHAWATVEREDVSAGGLALPVVVSAGVAAAWYLHGALDLAGPNPWVDWTFLTALPSTFAPRTAGIFPAIVGSLLLMIVVVVFAFPVGVGAAVYLEEYAPDSRTTRFIQLNISNLAGVPSVVYGLLGLAIFIHQFAMPSGSVLVGGLALGLLILPIVIISAREAIRSVPDAAREASYGMGATRWQTVRNVVLPQAIPGILTGTILALGRAIGETAPLLMIAAPATYLGVPQGFTAPAAAMPLQIYDLAFLPDDAFREGFVPAGVVTLLAVLLTMNGVAIVLRNRYERGN